MIVETYEVFFFLLELKDFSFEVENEMFLIFRRINEVENSVFKFVLFFLFVDYVNLLFLEVESSE